MGDLFERGGGAGLNRGFTAIQTVSTLDTWPCGVNHVTRFVAMCFEKKLNKILCELDELDAKIRIH